MDEKARAALVAQHNDTFHHLPEFPFEELVAFTGVFFNKSITVCGGQKGTYLASTLLADGHFFPRYRPHKNGYICHG